MIQLQNNNLQIKLSLHERECSTELLVFSKGVLKNFANFTRKYMCRVKCEPKSLIHPCSLNLHYKNTSLLEHSWASASDFIFDIFKSNKYMKVSFLLSVFSKKKIKIKQKSRLPLKLRNLRVA